MKKILFFGAPVFQIPVIEQAKKMGLYVGVIDIDPNAMAVEYADVYFKGSLRDSEQMLDIAKKFKPNGIVIGACDTSVYTASYVCEKLGLPGHSLNTALKATDKLQMLLAFERNGVAHPKFQLVSKEEIDNFERINYKTFIPYPVISKPIDNSGSKGIYYINNEERFYEGIRYSYKYSRSGNVLIEEYMSGPEVSVEMIVIEGKPYVLQITDKLTSGQPFFFETGHSQPSCLSLDLKNKIGKLAKEACIAVGLINSPAHVEIKITNDGPKMVELGARLGGDCISTYLLDNSIKGICLSETTIKMALGEKIEAPKVENNIGAVAVRFIISKKGNIKSIVGVDEALKTNELVKLQIIGKIGQYYNETSDNASRIGFVVSKGKTPKNALNNCKKIIDKIKISYSN